MFVKIAPKLNKILFYFWRKICHWELKKIVQSGPTFLGTWQFIVANQRPKSRIDQKFD